MPTINIRNIADKFSRLQQSENPSHSEILSDLDALLFDVRRLTGPLPAMERQPLRGVARQAIEKWSEIVCAYDP
jgi:hypothetical protein